MKTFLFLILTSVSLIAAKVPPEIVLQPNIVEDAAHRCAGQGWHAV